MRLARDLFYIATSASEAAESGAEPDEVWAYRARSVDDVTPVRVLRLGTKKPARVLVRFEDPAKEGHEEWVPPVRLKVPWADAETFRTREARWAAVLRLSPDRDAPEAGAASEVFELLVDDEVADLDWRDSYLRILTTALPAVFSGKYADSLQNEAMTLAALGRESEAQAVLDQAATIRRP